MRLHKHQSELVKSSINQTIFLEGLAGTGKTTVGVHRLRHLIRKKIPADSILVLTPQKALALPYNEELRNPRRRAGGQVMVATIGSLALHMVETFFPLVAEAAGFAHPDKPPRFLTLEMVQYYMAQVVGPEIERNFYFSNITIDRNRLYSQIVDNLNKSAIVGFPPDEISQRLKSAWQGDPGQQNIYDDAERCALLFRQFCYDNNLLDFSLQIHLFVRYLWRMDIPQRYLTEQYRHLIVDNLEEDNPAMHGILHDWLEECDSALLIYDTSAGYRRFLGADADSAYTLKDTCDTQIEFERNYVMSEDLAMLKYQFGDVLKRVQAQEPPKKGDILNGIAYAQNRYHTQMIHWTADHIASLIYDEGVSPTEIVVLSPLLSDSLRFTLMQRLNAYDVPVRSHRPSRALREEPATRALLALSRIAHPEWDMQATSFDVTYALMASIAEFDLTRARLLTEIVYRNGKLYPFDALQTEIQQRITYELGTRYDRLYHWMQAYMEGDAVELDFFFSRLFGEVLSQPGFGFHNDFDAAKTTANLIDSARNFRWTVTDIDDEVEVGREYTRMVEEGLIADLYIRDWEIDARDAVLIAPAYTYLMSNQPVDYQFWMNVGSPTWGLRLYQPLTHPYVLSAGWQVGRKWLEQDEYEANQDALYRLVSGLLARCRQRVYLGWSEYGEQGFEQRGQLLETLQHVLRRQQMEANDV